MHADHLKNEIDRIVQEAIGFYSGPETKTPWQRIMSHTRTAIAKEDNLSRANEASRTNKKKAVNPMELLVAIETHLIGMKPWVDNYPIHDGMDGERTWDVPELYDEDVPWARVVRDIVFYTANQESADKHLNILRPKQGHEYTKEEKSKWKKTAHIGFNKHERQHVVLLDKWPEPCTSHIKLYYTSDEGVKKQSALSRAVPRYYFGPILTAWMLAMAPRAKHRTLVIKTAIGMLMTFYNDNQKLQGGFNGGATGPPPIFDDEVQNEWYAFHTLRRMFRLRFGCSMCQHQKDEEWFETKEPSGSLYNFDPNEDAAFQTYKQEVKARIKAIKIALEKEAKKGSAGQ